MENPYTVIDRSNWKRNMHATIFEHYLVPTYNISFEIDITSFLSYVKKHQYPFTLALNYAITVCANQIEEFRYRFREGQIVLYESLDTSFTYMDKEEDLFKVVNVPMANTMETYVQLAKQQIKDQTAYFTGPLPADIYQFSSIPWISFSHISHTESGKPGSGAPMFDWGKYYEKEGHVLLPFSVQVHHSFVDGSHVGKFATIFTHYLDSFADML